MTWFLTVTSRFLYILPNQFLMGCGDWLGWFWFVVIRFRRKIVLDNLRLAFGNSLNEFEIRKLGLRNFQHYGRTIFETWRSIHWDQSDYLNGVIFEGVQNIEPFLKEGKGGFILTCHIGNWEIATGAVIAQNIPMDIVVKRAGNPRAERLQQWYRKKSGAGIIVESGTAKDILRSISKGRFIGFMLDQFMGPPIGLPVKFFGIEAGTAVALALLTEKRETPIIPAYSYRDFQGRLHSVFQPVIKFSELSEDKGQRLFEKTQQFNDTLEAIVRKYPEQWLWLHRRWKPYRGVPRWQFSPKAFAVGFLLLFNFSSSSILGEESTGIPIPPDPKLTTPSFKSVPRGEEDLDLSIPPASIKVMPAAPAISLSKLEKKNRKSRKIANRSELKPSPTSSVAASPKSIKLFDVIPGSKIPFEVGERLEIALTWTALPAGKAVLEVREGPSINSRPTFWFWGNALSSRLVDAIYHVNNTIESFVDKNGIFPYKFLLHMVESKQKKETRVAFDQPLGKAYYWSQRVSERWGNESKDREDATASVSQDMFSALYYARTLNYTLNQSQKFTVYENGQNFEIDLLPVANEFINSKVGAFQCWKILVTVTNNAVHNLLHPTGDMYMWLSDDSKRYLVRFDAKVKIGTLYGNLVGIQERHLTSLPGKR